MMTGPFNEGEQLRLICEVHGGLFNNLFVNYQNDQPWKPQSALKYPA